MWRGQRTVRTIIGISNYFKIDTFALKADQNECWWSSPTPSCCGGKLAGHICCLSCAPGSVGVFWADWQPESPLVEYLGGPCSAAPPDPHTHRSTPPPPSVLKHKCSEGNFIYWPVIWLVQLFFFCVFINFVYMHTQQQVICCLWSCVSCEWEGVWTPLCFFFVVVV